MRCMILYDTSLFSYQSPVHLWTGRASPLIRKSVHTVQNPVQNRMSTTQTATLPSVTFGTMNSPSSGNLKGSISPISNCLLHIIDRKHSVGLLCIRFCMLINQLTHIYFYRFIHL